MKTFFQQQFKLKPFALALFNAFFAGQAVADFAQVSTTQPQTATPIKHVIILIGENRTFDNIYGTYVPRKGQTVANLLSKGIVNADGTPGPHASMAAQSQLKNIPSSFFISQPASNKVPYKTLPVPNTSYVPSKGATLKEIAAAPGSASLPLSSAISTKNLQLFSPVLPVTALPLLTTGVKGMTACPAAPAGTPPQGCYEDDIRYSNYAALPNTVFPIKGKNLPYDSFTGDQVHRFYHMWEQSDCNVQNATQQNPSGCLNDLYPYVGVARNDGSTSNAMGFYNVQQGDAPILKKLANQYTISDNYHQPVMGGTFVQHQMIGTGDGMPWTPYTNQDNVTLSAPPINKQVDPTPSSSTSIGFTVDKAWTSCDASWAQAILDYEATLPWQPNKSPTTCTPGQYYLINNVEPGYLANGAIADAGITSGALVPPSDLRTIGDALNEKSISWAYYGGGYNYAVNVANGLPNNGTPLNTAEYMVGTSGDYYCDICNPFSYAKSIMGNPVQRKAHIKDATDFFNDLSKGNLPAVSYLKPDSFTDGHPASSKLNLFEALVDKVYTQLKNNPILFNETLFIVTWDEGGGYWDSGFFQPVDFFGDGPRIPLIAISPYTAGGNVDHTYADHASLLKFIERNWGLQPLTARSRDNLPNPVQKAANPYVPVNMPAVGDLFSLFKFNQ